MSISEHTIPVQHLLNAARALGSENGSNPEYDRALVELVMDSAGLGLDDKEAVYDLLGFTFIYH